MKLGPTNVVPGIANPPRTDRSAGADAPSSATRSVGGSTVPTPSVSVSTDASGILQARAAGSTGSVVDQAKVDAVRGAIASGTYKVNAGAIADKMLSNAEEILRRQSNQ